MDKNPFSLYDFLGYVIPGGVVLIFVWIITHTDIYCLTDIITLDEELMNLVSWNNILILMLASYIIGHFTAYVSTLTIERFALWNYDYPSRYLMQKKEKGKPNFVVSRYFNKGIFWKNEVQSIWRILLIILLFPISILSLLFGRWARLNRFVLKPLDAYMQNSINLKTGILTNHLGLSEYDKNKYGDVDFHRIVYHYEYEKRIRQSKKMDNYIALYGFLRSITLIFVVLFQYLLIYGVKHFAIIRCNDNIMSYILMLVIIACVSYIFYLSFMKFYRRYTVETFMTLITDEDLKKKER